MIDLTDINPELAERLVTSARMARLTDCDRSVISRLVESGKLQIDATIENTDGKAAPLFKRQRAEQVHQILADERSAK